MKKSFTNIHQDLINKCKAGNSKAQFEIYKLYYKAMFNTSYRIVNNKEEAEDVMQEAFLSAFNKIKTYKGNVSFGAWLKRITINQSLDFARKNKLMFTTEDELINIASEDESIEVKNEMGLAEIKSAIDELPDGYRIIISLFFLEGYDHEEISQILNISSVTSRTQLLRAKRKLKEILENK